MTLRRRLRLAVWRALRWLGLRRAASWSLSVGETGLACKTRQDRSPYADFDEAAYERGYRLGTVSPEEADARISASPQVIVAASCGGCNYRAEFGYRATPGAEAAIAEAKIALHLSWIRERAGLTWHQCADGSIRPADVWVHAATVPPEAA